MPTLGMAVAILDNDRILLINREDFEVWALPGGGVEAGESLAQAAVREASEETGLRVSLTRLVGVYSRPHWDHGGDHVVLFAGIPSGGVLLQHAEGEVRDARYFARHELPEALVPRHRQRICDALDGVGGGVAWPQTTDLAPLPQREYDAFMLDLKQTGRALQRALHPDHMNYECLGNSGPHLHWHVIPRYQNDPRWGQPVWEGWQRNEFHVSRVVIGESAVSRPDHEHSVVSP